MKKIVLPFFCLVFMCGWSFAQNDFNTGISLGIGGGVDYGGFGTKISVKPTPEIAISAGIGNYSGPPLAYGSIDNYGRLTSSNLTGLGYSVGIDFFHSWWSYSPFYTSIHYVRTGKYNGEEPFSAINWCIVGGNFYFNNVPLFIHAGINLTFFGYEKEVGGMIGVSVGIGYTFGF
jgi:hypothetical protein